MNSSTICPTLFAATHRRSRGWLTWVAVFWVVHVLGPNDLGRSVWDRLTWFADVGVGCLGL